MFSVSCDDLTEIIRVRDTILGEYIKHFTGEHNAGDHLRLSVFTGVADIICTIASPLNNLTRIPFMHDDEFVIFYGITENEFKSLTSSLSI